MILTPSIHISYQSTSAHNKLAASAINSLFAMIKGIIIVNNHGMPRMTKFYQNVPTEAAQQSLIRRIFAQVSHRPDSFCNYLENTDTNDLWNCPVKLIYRHYATLYFVFAVDSQESDLGILDLIQVFVECLDKCFSNVCELDLIFHSDRVHYILDEIVMGGMVLETNSVSILQSIQDQDKLHKESLAASSTASTTTAAASQRSSDTSRWAYNW